MELETAYNPLLTWKYNDLFKEHHQPIIMPMLLATGVVKPHRQRIIEGATLLERA
jgi:hypothetical protein